MSFLSIAGVTACLKYRLASQASRAVPGARITSKAPSGDALNQPRINVFLYQVRPNASLRNQDLPIRRRSGSVLRKARISFDLDYLISFFGDPQKLEDQRLLGVAAGVMEAYPVFRRRDISEALEAQPELGLEHSQWALPVDILKVTLVPMEAEAIARIWSMFFQTSYALSLCYRVQAVTIETSLDPKFALPVSGMGPRYLPLPGLAPVIDRITPPSSSYKVDAPIKLEGQHFGGHGARVLIAGQAASIIGTPKDKELTVALPASANIGMQRVEVIRKVELSRDVVQDLRSAPVALVIRPTIKEQTLLFDNQQALFQLPLEPQIHPWQSVSLLLNKVAGSLEDSYEIPAKLRENSTATASFSLQNIPKGRYLIRVRVDGIDSFLTHGPTDQGKPGYTGPELTIQ